MFKEQISSNELLSNKEVDKSRCFFELCAQSIAVIGVLCDYCQHRFCLKHLQAEIHGCGSKAQMEAKKQFHRQMSAHPPQEKKLTGAKRDFVQRKYNDKLKTMQNTRTSCKKK